MKDFIIRLESKEDYRATEHLIREAFWNARSLANSKERTLKDMMNILFLV